MSPAMKPREPETKHCNRDSLALGKSAAQAGTFSPFPLKKETYISETLCWIKFTTMETYQKLVFYQNSYTNIKITT
jgi:hypothetical protein